ncbi:hypothetical protein Tco_1538457 [Tanacetum coccineum]
MYDSPPPPIADWLLSYGFLSTTNGIELLWMVSDVQRSASNPGVLQLKALGEIEHVKSIKDKGRQRHHLRFIIVVISSLRSCDILGSVRVSCLNSCYYSFRVTTYY